MTRIKLLKSPAAPPCPAPQVLTQMEYGDYVIYLALVDPVTAQCWLDKHNTHNRKARKSRKLSYARDMEMGNWDFNGDTICRTETGLLVDGQHRLEGVVESGTTQMFLIVEGLPLSAQDTKDSGAARTFADALGLADMPYAVMVAAVARRVAYYNQGLSQVGGLFQPTRPEMRLLIEGDKDAFARAAEVGAHAFTNRLPVAPSVIGTAYYLCAKRDQGAADLFYVKKLIDSVGLERDEPAWTLQQKFKRENQDKKKIDPTLAFRFTLMAWNHFRDGTESLDRLMTPRGGWGPLKDFAIK